MKGLDEAPDDLWNSLFYWLIAGKSKEHGSLSHLSFIFTTRPGCHQLNVLKGKLTSKIIVKGFDKKSVIQFMSQNSPSNFETLAKKIEASPRFVALCSLPVNAATMTFLVRYFEETIPETQTGINKLLISNLLARHIQKTMGEQRLATIKNYETDLEAFPSIRDSFRKHCSLSYSALLINKRYFTIDDLHEVELNLQDDNLGLLQINIQTMTAALEYNRLYCFPHLSFQEFLAAIHLSLMDQHQQIVEVEQLFYSNPLNPILSLYAGLTRLENRKVFKILSSAIDQSLDDFTVLTSLLQNPSRMGDSRQTALAFFNCLYECQNERLMLSKSVQLKPSLLTEQMCQISMAHFSMTPADCLALGYFVKHTTLNMKRVLLIHVNMGKCSDTGLSSFLTEARKGINYQTKVGLALIVQNYVPQDESSPLAFKQFLQGQSNARMLQLIVGHSTSRNIILLLLKYIVEGLSANSSCVMFTLIFRKQLSHKFVHYFILLVSLLNREFISFNLGDINLHYGMLLFAEAISKANNYF